MSTALRRPTSATGVSSRRLLLRAVIWPATRIALSLVFLWAFLDKTFALGWSTGRDTATGAVTLFGKDAWINGASPTAGFLEQGTQGPLRPLFAAMAGNPVLLLGLLTVPDARRFSLDRRWRRLPLARRIPVLR